MKLASLLVFAQVAMLSLPSSSAAAAPDSASVADAFYAYKTAILSNRGQEAAGRLTSATAKYYEEMRDLALYATRAELKKQSTINLMQALTMRHRVPATELRGMSGTALLVYAIDHGWIGKTSVAPFKVKTVHAAGPNAVADIVTDQEGGSAQFRFRKENGIWRLDLLSIIEASSVQLDALAKQQGVTREELIFELLSGVSGRQVTDSVWKPPLTQAPAKQ